MRAGTAALALAVGAGCGGSFESSPQIRVDSPSPGGAASAAGPRGSTVTISFRVDGFTLAKPGACGGKPRCGQVYLFVDGKACGNPAMVVWKSPVEVDLASCGRVEGTHSITLALHEEAPARGAPAAPIEITFPIVVSPGAGTAGSCGSRCYPLVSILSPAQGEHLRADGRDKTFPVVVQVQNAILAPKGSCKGASGPCGHLELVIDGGACGAPNTVSTTTSFLARFGQCKHVNGQHTLTCELRDDDGRLVAASPAVSVQVKHENESDGEDDD